LYFRFSTDTLSITRWPRRTKGNFYRQIKLLPVRNNGA